MPVSLKRFYTFVIALGLMLVCVSFLHADEINHYTSSPYSMYALGELQPYATGNYAGIGGGGIGARNEKRINYANPASYSATATQLFLFDIAGRGHFSKYSYASQHQNTGLFNINYIALAFAINKRIGVSAGLIPYAARGYRASFTPSDLSVAGASITQTGSGNLTKAYIGVGVKITPKLSVGTQLNYLFGRITNNIEITPSATGAYTSKSISAMRIRDFQFTHGVQYTDTLKNNHVLTLGTVFEFKSNLIAQSGTLQTLSTTSNTDSLRETRVNVHLPLSIATGVAYQLTQVKVYADALWQNWADAQPTNPSGTSANQTKDRWRVSLGASSVPETFAGASFFKRLELQAGVFLERTYWNINGHKIFDRGVSLGVTIPFKQINSALNIAAQYGVRGTQRYNLIRENYTTLTFTFSSASNWFIPPKLN